MIDGKNIAAVVVCRKGSMRIKNKMWATLGKRGNAKPLFELKIRQLLEVKEIDQVIFGTDDTVAIKWINDKIKDPRLKCFIREAKFCDEKSATPNDMVKDMLSKFTSDVVLWAHSTNPFTKSIDYQDALNTFFYTNPNFKLEEKTLVSLLARHGHIWGREVDSTIVPTNFSLRDTTHSLAKDLAPFYFQTGAIFIRSYKAMLADGKFVGLDFMIPFFQNDLEGWDLDEPWQLIAAKALLNEGAVCMF